MTVAAVDADAAHMVGVAELNRLFDEIVLARVVTRQMEHRDDAAKRRHEEDDRQNAQPGVDIGMALEDLTHRVEVRARLRRPFSAP